MAIYLKAVVWSCFVMISQSVRIMLNTEAENKLTGGTCYILPCFSGYGPVFCNSNHQCECQDFYVANQRYCVPPEFGNGVINYTGLEGGGVTYVATTQFVSPAPGVELQVNVTWPASCVTSAKKVGYLFIGFPYNIGYIKASYLMMFGMNEGFLKQADYCAAQVMYVTEGSWASSATPFDLWSESLRNNEAVVKDMNSQSWSNGVVMPMGDSAMGIRSYLAGNMRNANIRAQYIGDASPSMRAAGFEQGVFRTGVVAGIAGYFGLNASFVTDLAASHEDGGPFWDSNAFSDWSSVSWPSHMNAGSFDIFQGPELDAYAKYRKYSQPHVRDFHTLSMDAGGHCYPSADWPNTTNATANTYVSWYGKFKMRGALNSFFAQAVSAEDFEVAMARFTKFLEPFPKVLLYVFSSEGDYLSALPDFPVFASDPLYLQGGQSLSLSRVSSPGEQVSFIYDPADPTPTYGGRFFYSPGFTPCGPLDQKQWRVNNSDKILYFTSEPLSEVYAIAGPVIANLVVGTNATDTDFAVKLIDMRTTGEEILVASGIARLAYRNGEEAQVLADVGKNYINVSLQQANWVFAKGSRIGVAIASSDSPGYRANPNSGVKINAVDQKITIANNTVHLGLSYLSLPKVDVTAIPRSSNIPEYKLVTTNMALMSELEKIMD